MRSIDNNSGYSLIEVLVVMGVTTMVLICTMSMMVGALSSFEGTTVQTHTDSDAVVAMQRIVSDIREAKSFTILDNGHCLQLTFPKVMTGGYYNRKEADTANPMNYYLSDTSGTQGQSGNLLWRKTSSTSFRRVARNIESVDFEIDTTRSVKITVVARNATANGSKSTDLTERVVYLRNY
jgi:Tfp pilus assembly protein PilW